MIDLALIPDGGLSWLDASGPMSNIVLSTRVRLARNLAAFPFAVRNREEDRRRILEQVDRVWQRSPLSRGACGSWWTIWSRPIACCCTSGT